MIVEVSLRFAVFEAGNQKFGRLYYGWLQGRNIVRSDQGFILIIFHFHDLYFIMATAFGFMHFHSAKPAFLGWSFKEAGRRQPLHAIVMIDHHSAGNHEITNSDYGKDKLFHEPG